MHYGLLQYSDVVDPIVRFKDSAGNKEIESFLNILDGLKYHSGFSTLTGAAMNHVRNVEFTAEMGNRADAKDIMIVVTDGKSKDKGDMRVEKIGKLIRDAGDLTVIAVGVNKAKHAELLHIASDESLVHETKKFSDLKTFLPQLFREVCKTTGGVASATTVATTTITTTTPVEVLESVPCGQASPICSERKLDLAIMLDAYQGVTREQHNSQRHFAAKLTDSIDIGFV